MDLSQALATFVDESGELLTQMEEILLQAERSELDAEAMNALFRCAHTVKGSAGLFGLESVVAFTHEVETLLDQLRQGVLGFSPALVGLLLEARDQMAALIDAETGGAADAAPPSDGLLMRLRTASGKGVPVRVVAAEPVVEVERCVTQAGGDCWHLSLRFDADLLQCGFEPLAMIHYLKQLGDIVHVETVSEALPSLQELDAECCYLGFEVALRSSASKADLESVFEFVLDKSRITILPPSSRIEDYVALIEQAGEDRLRLGDLLVACGSVTEAELARALSVQQDAAEAPRIGALLVEQGSVSPAVVAAALGQQRKVEERRAVESKSVKIPADRLDALINQVGELVIAGAATQLQAHRTQQRELQEAAANLLRLVEEVRDTALRLRMTPIGDVFSRFPRVVRDVARELGKEIELRISGAEAELDKSMVDKIGDPLMHLVRNSIDHGIESPERRASAGKPARGTVTLNAFHESGSIVIEVADDGGGLNTARIRAKGVEKGLIGPDASLSPAEIHRLIFEPGFSTAAQVTNLSGRGVGMDVVRSNIEALRGSIDIDSREGVGTTMRICLPLTLAIIDGFQVGVGAATFILPLDMVVECIELPQGSDGADYLNLRGEVLPFLRLRCLFDVPGAVAVRQNVVVVRFAGRKAGIVVDRLDGECQTVIKPLGQLFTGLSGISGSTILGSGEVALILDVAQLIQRTVQRGRAAALRQS